MDETCLMSGQRSFPDGVMLAFTDAAPCDSLATFAGTLDKSAWAVPLELLQHVS